MVKTNTALCPKRDGKNRDTLSGDVINVVGMPNIVATARTISRLLLSGFAYDGSLQDVSRLRGVTSTLTKLGRREEPHGVGRLFGAMSAKSGPVCVCEREGEFQRRLSAVAHHSEFSLIVL